MAALQGRASIRTELIAAAAADVHPWGRCRHRLLLLMLLHRQQLLLQRKQLLLDVGHYSCCGV